MEIPKIRSPHFNLLLLHDTPIFKVSITQFPGRSVNLAYTKATWKIFAFIESDIQKFWTSSNVNKAVLNFCTKYQWKTLVPI